jgi:hypothetical protein
MSVKVNFKYILHVDVDSPPAKHLIREAVVYYVDVDVKGLG